MVQPQSVPPQKKGLSVWAWVAIGCVGILVVCGVGFTALTWWGYQKAKSVAADIGDGKVKFDTPQGEASVSFDQTAGKMEVHGANGEVASFGAAAQLPAWVPAYPGAAAEGVYSAEDASQRGGTFGLTTTDSVSQAFAFYKGQLEGGGFKVTENHYSGPNGDGGMVVGESGDGKRTVTFTIAAESGKTRVAGVYSEKKG